MDINSTLGFLVTGYLQTVCPHDPTTPLEVELHLELIQRNLAALNSLAGVHFAYPVAVIAQQRISLQISAEGDYCYSIPCYVYTSDKLVWTEKNLPHGRFFAVLYQDYVNPLIGDILQAYNEQGAQ